MNRRSVTFRMAAIAGLGALGLCLRPAGAAGEEAGDGGAIKVSGRVVVTKRDGVEPAAATLTTREGKAYQIVMDERGRSLATVMHGERAEVLAEPFEQDGAGWLRVVGYTDERLTAGHELWRHMRCNACVVKPATENAAIPKDLRGATPIAGREWFYKRRFTAWARDEKFLWVAADNELLQFDLAAQKLVRSYGKAEKLPAGLVYQLVSDGRRLWIVHRGGVSFLDGGHDRINGVTLLPERKYIRAFAARSGSLWLVSDNETWRYDLKSRTVKEQLPALPTGARIAKAVESGIWTPHWERRTAHFAANPVEVAGRLYVGSFGDIYEIEPEAGKWNVIAENAYEQCTGGGKLYFLTSKGLSEHDPETGKTETLGPPEAVRGRYSRLVLTDSAAWIAAEPVAATADGVPSGGGIARFDLAARQWEAWPKIGERDAAHVSTLSAQDGAVWAVTLDGKYSTKSAHPGMTTTKRSSFETTGLCLQRYDEKAGKWESFPLDFPELGQRLICGQDGCRGMDAIVPDFVEELSVGERRVLGMCRLVPRKYFGGYWPCVEGLASRPDAGAAWAAKFDHRPEELWLQGEQPLVLNISNGELTRIGSSLKDQLWEAIGHDLVLGLFFEGGRHWAVTESCVACLDEATGAWRRLAEPEQRWYWRATAALEDGKSLYVGSDRGLVSRLDLETGRFELLGALKDRAVANISKYRDGGILVVGRPAPLGVLPAELAARLGADGAAPVLDAEAARFDGKAWTAIGPNDIPATLPQLPHDWSFRQVEDRGMWDKSRGNWLWGPGADGQGAKPRWYVKQVFFPQGLCGSPEEGRMWVSTYTGLLRLDFPRAE